MSTTNYLPSLIGGLYFPIGGSFAAKGHLKIPAVTTATYGKGTFISMTKKTWNNTQSQIKYLMMNTFSPNKLKISL